MKRFFRTSILIVILFAAITILTAKIERPVDGNNTYGFPLTFATEYTREEVIFFTPIRVNKPNLLIDLLSITVLDIGAERAATAILGKLRKK